MSSSKKCTFSDDMMEVLQDKRAPLSSFPRCKKKLETVSRRSDETIAVVTDFSKVEGFKNLFYQDFCPKNCLKNCLEKLSKNLFKTCQKHCPKKMAKKLISDRNSACSVRGERP